MYLNHVEIANFGCLRDVKLDLTPIHALIGPNDSGKSTILRAVRTLSQMLAMTAQPRRDSSNQIVDSGFDSRLGAKLAGQFGNLAFGVTAVPQARLSLRADYDAPAIHAGFSSVLPSLEGFWGLFGNADELTQAIQRDVDLARRITARPYLLRLDPDELRKESALIPDNEPLAFYEEGNMGMRGARLPGIYDAILSRGNDAFQSISTETRRLFPSVRNVTLRAVSTSQKRLAVELTNGQVVPAAQMSEGLLYFLAYAVLPYLSPPSILLVEEPENGLHPARIRDVVDILRKISKQTQVLIATHSPLVVNELQGNEVTLVTRDTDTGTHVRRLSETTDYESRSKVYAPGELWLSYADGVDEARLVGKP